MNTVYVRMQKGQALEAAGTHVGARKGPKPRFTRDEVLDVALDLLDTEGVARLSVRRLAAELGVTPMAIYRYFDGRDALVTAMVARAFQLSRAAPDVTGSWQEQLAASMRRLHSEAARHPGVFELIRARADASKEFDHLRERLVGILSDAGFDAPTTISALTLLISHAFGSMMFESFRRHEHPAAEVKRLRRLPADEFPHLPGLATEYVRRGSQEAFDYGLARIVAGLEIDLACRSRGTPRTKNRPKP